MADQLSKLFCCLRVYCPCVFAEGPADKGVPRVNFGRVRGKQVKVSNFFVAGRGTAIVQVPLVQTKAYWEFKISEEGKFCVGVCAMGKQGLDLQLTERKQTWSFPSTKFKEPVRKGDCIGVGYDLSDRWPVLRVYHNGKLVKKVTCKDASDDVYPCVSVQECMLESNFEGSVHEFAFGPPQGFSGVMFTRDIL